MPMLLLVGFLTRGPLGRILHVSNQCNPSLNNVYNNNNDNNNSIIIIIIVIIIIIKENCKIDFFVLLQQNFPCAFISGNFNSY